MGRFNWFSGSLPSCNFYLLDLPLDSGKDLSLYFGFVVVSLYSHVTERKRGGSYYQGFKQDK
jgi:hypothetical protein